MKRIFLLVSVLALSVTVQAQDMKSAADDSLQAAMKETFTNAETYAVPEIRQPSGKYKSVKNIVLLIGDGMGTAQVYAGLTANKGALFLQNCPYAGFAKTYSADKLITDSAAGGTALSTGKKTNNGAIGVDANKVPQKTILELAEEKGRSTGLVATCDITHATPASFIAHQESRGMAEEIAADFLKTDIDCFIGGGLDRFTKRKDGRNLVAELETKGYRILTEGDALQHQSSDDRIAALLAPGHLPPAALGRGDYLERATGVALELLSKNKEGFFLMIEGSQIDWGGHDNNTSYVTTEMLDFDKAIGRVLQFAAEDKNTLVVITADHETGGFSVNGGSFEEGTVKGGFTTGGHTAVMVPVFAFGPGAEHFSGIMDNTDIFHKLVEVSGL
jgi:alkaline phosphatase